MGVTLRAVIFPNCVHILTATGSEITVPNSPREAVIVIRRGVHDLSSLVADLSVSQAFTCMSSKTMKVGDLI